MMAKTTRERLTHREIIKLFKKGRYEIDPAIGEVISGRTNRPIYTYCGQDGKNRWCTLFGWGKSRRLPVAHAVWMSVVRRPIPIGFQIHHDDQNPINDSWRNLLCVHKLDHDKIHERRILPVPQDEVPF